MLCSRRALRRGQRARRVARRARRRRPAPWVAPGRDDMVAHALVPGSRVSIGLPHGHDRPSAGLRRRVDGSPPRAGGRDRPGGADDPGPGADDDRVGAQRQRRRHRGRRRRSPPRWSPPNACPAVTVAGEQPDLAEAVHEVGKRKGEGAARRSSRRRVGGPRRDAANAAATSGDLAVEEAGHDGTAAEIGRWLVADRPLRRRPTSACRLV